MISYSCDACKKQNIPRHFKIKISYADDDVCPGFHEYQFCRDCYLVNRDELLRIKFKTGSKPEGK